MGLSLITRTIVYILCIIGIYCSSSQRVIERIRYLENRINSESKFRAEDYEDIIARLDGIDKKLNASLERKVGIDNADRETGKVDLENVRNIREEFTRLRTAFREEKSESARIRREIPKIENNLISMKQNMNRYCVIYLNTTERLLSQVDATHQFIKKDISFQINEIVEEQKALQNEINGTSVREREAFINIATQIEENVQNIVEKSMTLKSNREEEIAEQIQINTTAKIERIGMLINKLYDRVEQLLVYDSCPDTKQSVNVRTGIYKLRNLPWVFCDHTIDGGGWTVFQRRQNGDVDFYRNWARYRTGFGDLNGDFWLGNEYLSILTATGDHELRIDMEDFDGNRAFAKYRKFKIYPEEDNYKIEVSGYSGTAGDSLEYHNGMAFTTFDNDNDKYSSNCAKSLNGAWWYNICYKSNLNGKYFNTASSCKQDGTQIKWYHWKGDICLKSVEMKFR